MIVDYFLQNKNTSNFQRIRESQKDFLLFDPPEVIIYSK